MPENEPAAQVQLIKQESNTEVSISSSIDTLPISAQLELFTEIAKDSNTGVTTPAMAMMLYHKAKELGIGWANAISHMHLVQGKLGIDIHIIKAILRRPSAMITVEKLEDFRPLYKFVAKDFTTTYTTDTLPANAVIVNDFKDKIQEGQIPVIYLPTVTVDANGTEVSSIEPYDYRTTYKFTRKKLHPDGKLVTEVVESSFSWQEALVAQLPLDRSGNFNTNSAWYKYRKLMMDHRAFTFGARDIAADLLLGAYETTELYDMHNMDYDSPTE